MLLIHCFYVCWCQLHEFVEGHRNVRELGGLGVVTRDDDSMIHLMIAATLQFAVCVYVWFPIPCIQSARVLGANTGSNILQCALSQIFQNIFLSVRNQIVSGTVGFRLLDPTENTIFQIR